MRYRSTLLPTLLASALAVGSALLGVTPALADDGRTHIDDGSVVLFDARLADDGTPSLSLMAGDVLLAPDAARVVIDGDRARTQLPDQLPPEYDGVLDPGAVVYQAPGTATDGLPTLGWSTLGVPAEAAGQAPTVTIGLEVDGPGAVLAYGADADGSVVSYVDTGDDVPDSWPLPAGGYGWPTWVFDEPGTYVLHARPTITDSGGTSTAGPVSRYLVEVTAPEEPTEPVSPDPDPTAPEPGPGPGAAPSEEEPGRAPQAESPLDEEEEEADRCDVPGLADDAVVVADGHFDYGVQVQNGQLRSRVKDDRTDPPTWRRPDGVLFSLGEPAKQQVPESATYSFLGTPGDPVWTIGQSQQDGVPWLGWNTQHESAIANIDGATTWRLDSVDGPGELFVYQTGSFGAVTRILSAADGWPRSTRIAANTHVHANWSFTEPGVYQVTTTHRATLVSGQESTSQATLYLQVGPCADDDLPDEEPQQPDPKEPKPDRNPERPPAERPAPQAPAAPPAAPPAPVQATCTPAPVGGTDAPDDGDDTPGDDTPATQEPVSEGHFDFGPEIVSDDLVARVKDDRTQPPSWVAPESFRFVLGKAAEQRVPSGASYSFLGKPGDPIWLMPQTQVAGVPWLGWNTQHESVRSQVRGSVRFTLDALEGPGQLAVYLNDSFGGVGQKVVGSVGGFPRSFDVPLNVHTHGNWAFTQPGSYQLTMTQSATLANGDRVDDRATLHFTVGASGAAPSSSTPRAVTPLVVPALALAQEPSDDTDAEDDEEPADDEAADTGPTVASTDCQLPDAGVDGLTTLLLPLGVTLVGTGCALLVLRRRAMAASIRG